MSLVPLGYTWSGTILILHKQNYPTSEPLNSKKIDLLARASISLDWLRTQSNIFAGGDPGIFHWGGGRPNFGSERTVELFVANYFSTTPSPTSHWEGRNDYVFLNLWKPVAVGAGNTALRAEANRSWEGTQRQSHFWISLEFSFSGKIQHAFH